VKKLNLKFLFSNVLLVTLLSSFIFFLSSSALAKAPTSYVEQVVEAFKFTYRGSPQVAFKKLEHALNHKPGSRTTWSIPHDASQVVFQVNVLSRIVTSQFFKLVMSKSDKVKMINLGLNLIYNFNLFYWDLIDQLVDIGGVEALTALHNQIHGLHSRIFINLEKSSFYENYIHRVHGPKLSNLWGITYRQSLNRSRPLPTASELTFIFEGIMASRYKNDLNKLIVAAGQNPSLQVQYFLLDYIEPQLKNSGSNVLMPVNLKIYLDWTQKFKTRSRCDVVI